MGDRSRKSGDNENSGAFGTALRSQRQRLALSQEELSEATRGGVAVRTISDLERGVARRPRAETVRLLAGALGLAGAELAAFQAAARAGRPVPEWRPAPPARDRAVPGRRGLPGALLIVTDPDRLAEVQSLLSAAADYLVVLTGANVLAGPGLQLAVDEAMVPAPEPAALLSAAARPVRRPQRPRPRRRP